MPGIDLDNPLIGYAAFCGIKFLGYSGFAVMIWHRYWERERRAPPRDGEDRITVDWPCPKCRLDKRAIRV